MTMNQVPRAATPCPATAPKPPQRDATRLKASPRCGARTRRGDACRAPAVGGKARCRMHGEARGSGGQPGNRNAWKHGLYDRAAKAANRRHQALLCSARGLLHRLEEERRGQPFPTSSGGCHILGRVQRPAANPGVHGLVCQVPPGHPLDREKIGATAWPQRGLQRTQAPGSASAQPYRKAGAVRRAQATAARAGSDGGPVISKTVPATHWPKTAPACDNASPLKEPA